jgi:hypothetical protein
MGNTRSPDWEVTVARRVVLTDWLHTVTSPMLPPDPLPELPELPELVELPELPSHPQQPMSVW